MAYPAALDSFTANTDDVDDVLAADMNAVQTAIENIETELGTDPAGSVADVKTRLAVSLTDTGSLKLTPGTTLTISSGVITITGNYHKVETEASAASDDLDTINGGAAGLFVRLVTVNDARDVVIKHGTGNIYCMGAKDITLSTSYEACDLQYDTTNTRWIAFKCPPGYSLVGNISGGGTLITAGYNLTLPATGTAALLGTANVFTAVQRTATSLYRRYYHIALGAANPGASGATFVVASANTTGGWRLTNAIHLLRGQVDVHADWDGASDPTFGVKFMCNVNNTGGGVGDTVDLKATVYYKGTGDTACKSQVVEVSTVIGQSPQYKQFTASFPIDWDAVSNVLEVGDIISIILNLETDTSEVDDIVITAMEFSYLTTHIGIENGDE